jgi:hypothetical protein
VQASLPRVRTLIALAAVAAALAAAAGARADADPASDVLYVRPLFVPYTQKVSPPVEKKLLAAIRAAKVRGKEIRVALIADQNDLGGVPALFGKPTQYVRFLSEELQLVYGGRLLVVMPQGAGLAKGGQGIADPTVASVHPGTGGDALGTAATQLVQVLSGQKPRSSVNTTATTTFATPVTSSGGGNSWLLVLAIVAGAGALAAWGFFALRRWARK